MASQSDLVNGLSGSCGNVSSASKQRPGFDANPSAAPITDDGTARNFGRDFGEKFESFRTRMDRMRLQLLHEAVVLSRGGFPGRGQRSGNDVSSNAMVAAGLCNPYVSIRYGFTSTFIKRGRANYSSNKVARSQPPTPINKYKLGCYKFKH